MAVTPQHGDGNTLNLNDGDADDIFKHVAGGPTTKKLASSGDFGAGENTAPYDEAPMVGENSRTVDNWVLGETLGKGAYGIVKIGYMKGSNRPFALKFMHKDRKWSERDKQQVANEINCLRRVSHENVTRLMAYRLNCPYPKRDGGTVNSVLLVMELCSGGELFDILFYTKQLEEKLARTYMKQLMSGLKAVHDLGITHRDLKPQNCLLDGNYNLKIADFGLSNIFEGEGVNILKTTIIGTKGYRAPEIVLNRKYTNLCDIFACGVIMFICVWGYPPFETADANDGWYRPIATKKFHRFWKKHKKIAVADSGKELLMKMLAYQPADRSNLDEVLASDWLQEEIYTPAELKSIMAQRHKQASEAKRNDSAKQKALNESMVRSLEEDFGTKFNLDLLPEIIDLSKEHLPPFDTFSIKSDKHAYHLLDALHDKIKEKGVCKFYQDMFILEGDLELGTKEILTIKARCFRVDESNTCYVSFSRTCSNFLGSYNYFQEVLSSLAYMLDQPYHIEPQVIDYSDIPLENDMGDPLPEPILAN